MKGRRKEERRVYLLELSPALGEDDDLVVERLPCGVLEAEVDDVDEGLHVLCGVRVGLFQAKSLR